MKTIYDINVTDNHHQVISLKAYQGKVLLIVNTATGCGFTPQYTGLQKLYDTYHDQGLEILDFPCNQFKEQAPGSIEEIGEFCKLNYGTTFQQFDKVDVNGESTAELFNFLKQAKKGLFKEDISWNFTKFLVDSTGEVIKRYAPITSPSDIEKDIVKLLK